VQKAQKTIAQLLRLQYNKLLID